MPQRARKSLGQHFLVSPRVIERIIGLVEPQSGDDVIEIGPGRGALTKLLADSGCRLTAVELDDSLADDLRQNLAAYSNLKIIQHDFLEFEPCEHGLDRYKVVGNIAYNITSPVIDWCDKHRSQLVSAVLMVQKELADRISGSPGTKDWSPIAIFTQLGFEVKKCFHVAPGNFRPPPKIRSTVLRLIPRQTKQPYDAAFERVVRTSFVHRRKQLVNNLVPEIIPTAEIAREIFGTLSFKPKVRAEGLTIDQFFKLTDLLKLRKLV